MNRNKIKQIAVDMVKQDGLINLSRLGLCSAAKIASGSFVHVMNCTFSEFITELQEMNIPSEEFTAVKSRTHPALRKEYILNKAVDLARDIGYQNITQNAVAEAAGVSSSLVPHYFTMASLKTAVVQQAVNCEILDIVIQAIIAKHPLVKYVSEDLKRRAINHVK